MPFCPICYQFPLIAVLRCRCRGDYQLPRLSADADRAFPLDSYNDYPGHRTLGFAIGHLGLPSTSSNPAPHACPTTISQTYQLSFDLLIVFGGGGFAHCRIASGSVALFSEAVALFCPGELFSEWLFAPWLRGSSIGGRRRRRDPPGHEAYALDSSGCSCASCRMSSGASFLNCAGRDSSLGVLDF